MRSLSSYCAFRVPRAAAVAVLLLAGPAAMLSGQDSPERERPSLTLRSTPTVGFTPLNVRVVADLREGDDDHPDYYCPLIQWEWGDGTMSESSLDCEPYQAGVSAMRRQYTSTHTYRQPGSFRLRIRLLQDDDTVDTATDRIQVRGGF